MCRFCVILLAIFFLFLYPACVNLINAELTYTMVANEKCDIYSFIVIDVASATFMGRHTKEITSSLQSALPMASHYVRY